MKVIGTHDGCFHCDEVLACAMLTNFVKNFKGATVRRSRDPQVWKVCDVLLDVGGKYEPPFLLDHHQIEFNLNYPEHDVRLSSAGLVYLNYPEIVPNMLQTIIDSKRALLTFEPILTPQVIDKVRKTLYKRYLIYVDAVDNGVSTIAGNNFIHHLPSIWVQVGRLNPMWWEKDENVDARFHKAMERVAADLLEETSQIFLGVIQTKEIIREAVRKRKQVHPSGRMIKLEYSLPWIANLFELEEEENCKGEILYTVYPDGKGKWRIQAVPVHDGSFESRHPLKAEWRGIKDMPKLIEISKIPDITFVHASGFIGGATSLANTIFMGEQSMGVEK